MKVKYYSYLQIYRICMVILSREHSHGVVEDVASTLNTLIQPCGPMLFFIKRDRESLASAVIHCIDDSNVKFVGVL